MGNTSFSGFPFETWTSKDVLPHGREVGRKAKTPTWFTFRVMMAIHTTQLATAKTDRDMKRVQEFQKEGKLLNGHAEQNMDSTFLSMRRL
ncbi:hypothetical protein NPIL_576021 [Nephila pilipes]|uniref:Uncharacterized protein n=1 Tax=Nephila pilipes TaxID=299642 RepID=A0A8X6UIN4_NEPPI|nr:hypothetical protein NPIL_576021 [Nephila pilipes]